MKKIIYSLCLALPLFGCGGGGGTTDSRHQLENPTDYSALKTTQLEPGPLRQASSADLAELVKNGLRISLRENQSFSDQVRTSALGNSSGAVTDAKNAGNFSGTNVQVEGADEADIVKYDGRYMYVATPVVYDEAGPQAAIKIFENDPSIASSREVGNIKLDTAQWGDVSDLYLVADSPAANGLVAV